MTVLMIVLMISSGFSVFFKSPGPVSYPFHLATFIGSVGYLTVILIRNSLRSRQGTPMPSQQPVAIWRQRLIRAGVIFFACLVVYQIELRGTMHHFGGFAAPYAAWSFVRTGGFNLRDYQYLQRYVGSEVVELSERTWVSRDPPGSALAALPLVAPLAAFREQPLQSHSNMRRIGKFVAAIYSALSVVLFYWVCSVIAPAGATLATVLFALGTNLWSVASQGLLMHAPATFWLCAALFLLCKPLSGEGRYTTGLLGLVLGMAVLTRPVTILFGLATLTAQIFARQWQKACWTAAGAGVPVAGLLYYNSYYFGRLFTGTNGDQAWLWESTLWLGLSGLLIAPSTGLFIYSPSLILAPLGLLALIKNRVLDAAQAPAYRMVIICWSTAALALVIVCAKWHDRSGGWSFGPRLLIETLPILCLLFALAYERLTNRAWRFIAIVLVVISITIHLLGVFGRHKGSNQRYATQGKSASMFSLRNTQIEAHARYLSRIWKRQFVRRAESAPKVSKPDGKP